MKDSVIRASPSTRAIRARARCSLQGQAQGPELEAAVDMDRLAVGEELTYTLRAVSHSPAPTHVTIEPFTGTRARCPAARARSWHSGKIPRPGRRSSRFAFAP